MVMTRAQFARDLQDGLNAHFGMEYGKHEPQWTEIFEQKVSRKAYEEQVLRVGLGEAQQKAEGASVSFDNGSEGWVARYQHHTYALAFAVTEEAVEDNLYADLIQIYGAELARALQHAKEVRGASVLNNAFSSSYPGGDGVSLCNASHPLYSGNTLSNVLTTASDPSEEAFEDALIQVDGFVTDRDRPIVVKPKKVIVARQQAFVMERLMKSDGRVGTGNNDINALKNGNFIPSGYRVNNYLQDPDAWFIMLDCPQGLQHFKRRGIKKGMETEFGTGNMMYKVSERYAFGWTNPRAIIGSAGA